MAELQNADQLEKTLRGIDTTDAVRADAWDAYANAKTPDELVGSLKSLKIPPAGKKQLVDMWGPDHGYKVVGKAEAAKSIAKPPEQPKAAPGPPKEQEGDPWYKRAAKGLYDSTVGQAVTASDQMEKHPIEAAISGPIGPAIHEGIKSAISSRARAADTKLSTADRIEAGLGALPPGPVGAAGTMAQHVMHKLRSGDVAGLAGEGTGTALMALLLGKIIPGGGEEAPVGASGEAEISGTAEPVSKPDFSEQKPETAPNGRQIEGRNARQIAGPPEPPGPPDRVFEQGPISHKQIEGPRNSPATPGARPLNQPVRESAGPPKQIAARQSGPNPQPTWDMTLAWAKRLPPDQLQGIVSKMRDAVSEHGEKLSPEDRAVSQERLQKLEELLPKKNGIGTDASHKATPGPESAKAAKPNPIDKSDRTRQQPAENAESRPAAKSVSNVGQSQTEAITRAVDQAKQWGSKRAMLEVISDKGRVIAEQAFNPANLDANGLSVLAGKLARGRRFRLTAMDQVGRKIEGEVAPQVAVAAGPPGS